MSALAVDPLAFARDSLLAYAIGGMPRYEVGRHHRAIARALERVESGECKRLMIFAPPRHGKSELASRVFPAWYLGRNPERYIIAATYGQELANDLGRDVRNRIADPWHQAVFPACTMRRDSKAAARFHTGAGGVYYGVGAGTAVTGRGAHIFLIDDPIKGPKEAASETIRESVKSWYRSVAYTRLMAHPDGAVVVIQTRWHEDDLSGWLLRENRDEGWEVISLPAIAEDGDMLGRAPGEALWPEWYPLERLERIRSQPGAHATWSALYQQRPLPASGGLIKREWLVGTETETRHWRALPAKFDELVASWDCAFKGATTSDYVVGQVWGRAGGLFYLVDQVRGRMDFPATLAAVRALRAKWPACSAIYIEDKANGPAVIASLQREIPRLIPVNPEGGKETRVNAIAPLLEAGNVRIPHPSVAPWVGDFVSECASFPLGANDDQVDAMSQALVKLERPAPARGVVDESGWAGV